MNDKLTWRDNKLYFKEREFNEMIKARQKELKVLPEVEEGDHIVSFTEAMLTFIRQYKDTKEHHDPRHIDGGFYMDINNDQNDADYEKKLFQ